MHPVTSDTVPDNTPIALLYQRYARTIQLYLHRFVASKEDVDDLLLEVFLAALKKPSLRTVVVQRRLELLAACLIAALIVGSMLTIFTLLKHPHAQTGSHTNIRTVAAQAQNTLYLTYNGTAYKLDTHTRHIIWRYVVPAIYQSLTNSSIMPSPPVQETCSGSLIRFPALPVM